MDYQKIDIDRNIYSRKPIRPNNKNDQIMMFVEKVECNIGGFTIDTNYGRFYQMLDELEGNFEKENDHFNLKSNFYIISGWKDHSSQQKPIRPGQAKNKLADFL